MLVVDYFITFLYVGVTSEPDGSILKLVSSFKNCVSFALKSNTASPIF